MQGSRIRAFTLIELLFIIILISVLTTMAIGGVNHLVQDKRMSSALNGFQANVELARSHALRSGYATVICKSIDGRSCNLNADWDQGWMIFEDRDWDRDCSDLDGDGYCDKDKGKLIRIDDGVAKDGLSLSATGNSKKQLVFKANGLAEGYAGTFSLCDPSGRLRPRGVVLSMTGRMRPATDADKLSCKEI